MVVRGMADTETYFQDSPHAKLYAKYRPSYPKQVLDAIHCFLRKYSIGAERLVDIGCGSGQSIFPLVDHFEECVGVDISKAQIDCAEARAEELEKKNVRFVVASASSLPFEDESVDVVVCSSAWHWLDPKTANPEIARVLKTHGCLIVSGYARGRFSSPKCETLYEEFNTKTLAEFTHPNVQLAVDHYRNVVLPFKLTERHDMMISRDVSVSAFVGFISSLSSYQLLCEKHPGSTVLEDLARAMKAALQEESKGEGEQDPVLSSTYPTFLLFCLKE